MEYSLAHRTDRTTVRHAAKLDCHVVAEKGFRTLKGRTLDVSDEGLRLSTDADVEIGENVILAIRLPHGRSWVDAHGRVVRIERGARNGDPGRAIAIRFTAIDPVDRGMLKGAIAKVPPPVPRRDLRIDFAATVIAASLAC